MSVCYHWLRHAGVATFAFEARTHRISIKSVFFSCRAFILSFGVCLRVCRSAGQLFLFFGFCHYHRPHLNGCLPSSSSSSSSSSSLFLNVLIGHKLKDSILVLNACVYQTTLSLSFIYRNWPTNDHNSVLEQRSRKPSLPIETKEICQRVVRGEASASSFPLCRPPFLSHNQPAPAPWSAPCAIIIKTIHTRPLLCSEKSVLSFSLYLSGRWVSVCRPWSHLVHLVEFRRLCVKTFLPTVSCRLCAWFVITRAFRSPLTSAPSSIDFLNRFWSLPSTINRVCVCVQLVHPLTYICRVDSKLWSTALVSFTRNIPWEIPSGSRCVDQNHFAQR